MFPDRRNGNGLERRQRRVEVKEVIVSGEGRLVGGRGRIRGWDGRRHAGRRRSGSVSGSERRETEQVKGSSRSIRKHKRIV